MVKGLIIKYQELIMYGIFGVGATLINIFSYKFFVDILGIYFLVANVIAWILAFVFAFITNKLFVFKSKSWERASALKEFIGFFTARIGTGVLDTALMYVFITTLKIDDTVSKVIINIIVIIINYVASKFWIFKRKEDENVTVD